MRHKVRHWQQQAARPRAPASHLDDVMAPLHGAPHRGARELQRERQEAVRHRAVAEAKLLPHLGVIQVRAWRRRAARGEGAAPG